MLESDDMGPAERVLGREGFPGPSLLCGKVSGWGVGQGGMGSRRLGSSPCSALTSLWP